MSLAAKFMKQRANTAYALQFDEFDELVMIRPLTVEQRAKVNSLKSDEKQQAQMIAYAAYTETGDRFVKDAKEALELDEDIAAFISTCIHMRTMGAADKVIDKAVQAYKQELKGVEVSDEHIITEEDRNPN
ncbi:hypothetical protein [Shewanella frigidimarina]|uniref:hypothetical protein n=1 Tax=Shewanella frigidimarina TaxID=56812 RepID=UPI003D7B7FF3